MSNVNDNFIDDFGMDCSHCTDSVEPIDLVAQVFYANGDDSTNRILNGGKTHYMIFFRMNLST